MCYTGNNVTLYSEGTTDGQILHKAQQTLTILSRDVSSPGIVVWQREIGIVLCKIVYLFLTRPMTRSTWIRTAASPLVVSSSLGCSCCFPLVKAGNLR